MIDVVDVTKDYRLYNRDKGLIKGIRSLFRREYTVKRAVDDISFHIGKGELVGYVGPNGAGKSTTIKILSGILIPTTGTVTVNGRNPSGNRVKNAMDIGVIIGQRSQLYWDLPVEDSFLLHKRLYDIPESRFRDNVNQFIEVLQMRDFLHQPVRQLSLGQKMRANIAISLLHDPLIVYLDEPTIGLDIVAKGRIRDFIRLINQERQTTVILTTHDMDDIEEICKRIIVIDKGKIRYDGNLGTFKSTYGGKFNIEVAFEGTDQRVAHPMFTIIGAGGEAESGNEQRKYAENRQVILCDKKDISIADAVTYITSHYKIKDIHIIESDIEDILIKMYTEDANA